MTASPRRPPTDDESGLEVPTPAAFYVHDDLSEEVQQQHGADSAAFRLTQQLLDLVRRDCDRVRVLTVAEQVDLLRHGEHIPFAVTIGIGLAGERVAQELHRRTGWFPAIRRVDLRREEDAPGQYRLASSDGRPLETQVDGLAGCASLAVVDDTVFSGLTMRSVLEALPPAVLGRTHAFCLRAVEESLQRIRSLCPISAGFRAPGRILKDVSFINASGLVKRVGIWRASQPPMAFFERPAWVRSWFPGYADEVVELCRRLNALLEPER